MKSLLNIMILSFGLMAVTTAHASLIDRGGGLIYDTDLNITWLANANVNSLMTWGNATIWAINLSYAGYDDWRLPTRDTSCSGYNCTGGEMGHLFYDELGGTAAYSILSSTDPDLALFTNVQQSNLYWSGSEFAPDPHYAWGFDFNGGYQYADNKIYNGGYAWAVRPGDVAAVPVPAAAWLFGSGLLGLAGVARRQAGGRAP